MGTGPGLEGFQLTRNEMQAFSLSELSSEVCRCLWGKEICAADLKIVFVLNGEPQSRYEILTSSHTSRKCYNWSLCWAALLGEESGFGVGVHPERPLPPPTLGLDSAFMRIYFKVCIQMCGFAVRDLRAGKQMCCAERFEPQPSRPRGSEFAFSSLPRWAVRVGCWLWHRCRAL